MTAARSRSRFIDGDIAAYALAHTSPADDVQVSLQAATAERTGGAAGMQIGHDQAVFMENLARAMGARRAVEVGVFTGYSSLALARGMAPDGRLLACDVSDEWTAIAREHWEKAGVAGRIDLRLAPALDTLRSLPAEDRFDLAFVDADKEAYLDYYEEILPRLRPGGVLLADNTLWGGRIIDPAVADADTVAIRAFNDALAADGRVRVVVLTIGDGVTLAQRL
ncbi:MAG: O-methyltransferase [Acidimicrobiia bacterium]